MTENEERMTIREAAKQCRRNPETVRRWIWSGKLPAEKLGNQLFVKKSDLASYCKETAVEYRAGAKSDLMDRMRSLREQIRARVGNLDVDKTIEQLREERMEEIEPTSVTEERVEFMERAIAFREKLRARGYPETDMAALVRKSREGRMRELRQSLRRR